MEPWRCWVCGHWPADPEEQEPAPWTLHGHLADRHNLSNALLSAAKEAVDRAASQRIMVGSDGIDVRLLLGPDRFALEVVGVLSLVNTAPANPSGQDYRSVRRTLGDPWEALAEVLRGDRLPNAMEALTFAFFVGNVSRTCTHQLVRTRHGAAFLQQTSRASDLRGAWFRMPITIFGDSILRDEFIFQVNEARRSYAEAVDAGVPYQDARFLLPDSMCTHLAAVYNWPTLQRLAQNRLRNFMQWEINSVLRAMRREVKLVTPELAELLGAGCETSQICQQREDALQGCGRFPNPHDADPAWHWKTLRTGSPHGYRFDETKFG